MPGESIATGPSLLQLRKMQSIELSRLAIAPTSLSQMCEVSTDDRLSRGIDPLQHHPPCKQNKWQQHGSLDNQSAQVVAQGLIAKQVLPFNTIEDRYRGKKADITPWPEQWYTLTVVAGGIPGEPVDQQMGANQQG